MICSIQGKQRIYMQQATYKGNVPSVLNQEFLFLVHEYWGSEATHFGWSIGSYETWSTRKPSAKAVPETDYLTQRKQYHKRTTLCTMKIPLWSIPSKEGPHYRLEQSTRKLSSDKRQMPYVAWVRWESRCKGFRSEEGPHYRLGAKREEAVIWQVTINLFTSLDIPGDSIPRLYCVAWLMQEKVSPRIFVRKEGMNHVQSNGFSKQKPLAKRRKRENSPVVRLLPGSHERLALRNPHVLFQKHGGACTMY